MNESRSQEGGFLTGLILGAIMGAGFFYFLTETEKGKEVGRGLKKKSKDTMANLAEIIEEIEEKGKEFTQKITQVKGELEKENIEELKQRGRQAVRFFTRNGKPLG